MGLCRGMVIGDAFAKWAFIAGGAEMLDRVV
jgi:hypothetical protein